MSLSGVTSLAPYQLDHEIDRIKGISPTNQVALIMGRDLSDNPSNHLPPAQEKMTWVSLDIHGKEHSLQSRIHLMIDFNTSQLEKINGLFDLVVIDPYVLKYYIHPVVWGRLAALLKPSGELISETVNDQTNGITEMSQDELANTFRFEYSIPIDELNAVEQQNEAVYQEYKTNAENFEEEFQQFLLRERQDWEECGQDFDSFPMQMHEATFKQAILNKLPQPAEDIYQKSQRLHVEKTEKHLKTLFESVEIVKGKPFPYQSTDRYHDFFILKHPKG
jgi:hypothetical protein